MDKIPKFIEDLSNKDLRQELQKVGINSPITPTTRRLFQKKLARKLGITAVLKFEDKDLSDEPLQSTASGETAAECSELPDQKFHHNEEKKSNHIYYGVFIPKSSSDAPECLTNSDTGEMIFENKENAIKEMKSHKHARFKSFSCYEDAQRFVMDDSKTESNISRETNTNKSELSDESNRFKTPKQEELNVLMNLIMQGDLENVKNLVWNNPKYLITSADAPTILKASARYNAIHVAAKANKAIVCREILSVLGNLEFHQLMYGKKSDPNVMENRIKHLIDWYLNMPDKGMFETPLHIACKLGHRDVVTELISYSLCDLDAKNKFGDAPSDIVCSRAAKENLVYKAEVEKLLVGQYFIPLLRNHDNTEQAIVGNPWNTKRCCDVYGIASPKMQDSCLDSDSPLRPDLKVSAIAGPMSKAQAETFRTTWTTPSKHKNLGKRISKLGRADSEKGHEHIGRVIAATGGIGWLEYWDFLTGFADFTKEESLEKLEEYLMQRLSQEKKKVDGDISDLADMFDTININESQPKKELNAANCIDIQKQSNTNSRQMEIQRSPSEGVNQDSAAHSLHDFDVVKKLFGNVCEKKEVKSCASPTGSDIALDLSERLLIDKDEDSRKLESTAESPFCADRSSFHSALSECYRCPTQRSSDVFSSPSSESCSSSDSMSKQCKEGEKIFLTSMYPTKLDRDVTMAIGDTHIDKDKYPLLNRWKSCVLEFSEPERQRWRTPRKQIPQHSRRNFSHTGVAAEAMLTPKRNTRFFL